VAGSRLGLQLGAPSVASTSARAVVAARTPDRTDAAKVIASAVGVPPPGMVFCIREMSGSTSCSAGDRLACDGIEQSSCANPDGKRRAPIAIVASTGGNVCASPEVSVAQRDSLPEKAICIEPDRSSTNMTSGWAAVSEMSPGTQPTGSVAASTSPGPASVSYSGSTRSGVRAPQPRAATRQRGRRERISTPGSVVLRKEKDHSCG